MLQRVESTGVDGAAKRLVRWLVEAWPLRSTIYIRNTTDDCPPSQRRLAMIGVSVTLDPFPPSQAADV